jgi:hypothetical protein
MEALAKTDTRDQPQSAVEYLFGCFVRTSKIPMSPQKQSIKKFAASLIE